MNYKLKSLCFIFIILCVGLKGFGQEPLSAAQKEIVKAMEKFSETTAPGGAGAEGYAAFLTEDFSRWTIGSKVTNDKDKWVEGVRAWFDDGWRVSSRETQNLEILVVDNFAFTRRIVTETYLGPEGDSSVSKAALVEIWTFRNKSWLLYRVNVHPMDN